MAQRISGGNGALALRCNAHSTGAIFAVLIPMFGSFSGSALQPGWEPFLGVFLALPPKKLAAVSLQARLRDIGRMECATAGAKVQS